MADDDDTLKRALEKRRGGQRLTREELRALKAAQEEANRRVLRTISKKLYCELSGRQTKVVNEQAERYGLPLLGETVDMFAVCKAFHDLLREHGHKITEEEIDDERETSPMLERLRAEKWRLAKMDRLERRRQLISREFVRDVFNLMANLMREGGDKLRRRGNIDGAEAFEQVLDSIDGLIAARGKELGV